MAAAAALVGEGARRRDDVGGAPHFDSASPHLLYRPLHPRDLPDVRAAHAALFPLDYDDVFFVKATSGADRIYSYAAYEIGRGGEEEDEDDDEHGDDEDEDDEDADQAGSTAVAMSVDAGDSPASCPRRPPPARRRRPPSHNNNEKQQHHHHHHHQQRPKQPREHLVGFATARLVRLHECEPPDRRALGLAAAVHDSDLAAYVLTLGVVEGPWRRAGVAGALVRMCCAHAAAARCRVAFLHVADFNGAAVALYTGLGFSPLARLPGFYSIGTGRQPDPGVTRYDALLYALPLARADGARLAAEIEGAGCRAAGFEAPSPFCARAARAPWWWGGGGLSRPVAATAAQRQHSHPHHHPRHQHQQRGAQRRAGVRGWALSLLFPAGASNGGGGGGADPASREGDGEGQRQQQQRQQQQQQQQQQRQHQQTPGVVLRGGGQGRAEQDGGQEEQEEEEVSSAAAARPPAAARAAASWRIFPGACAPPAGVVAGVPPPLPTPRRQQPQPQQWPAGPSLVAPPVPLASRDARGGSDPAAGRPDPQGQEPQAPSVPTAPPSRRESGGEEEGERPHRQQQQQQQERGGGGVLRWLFSRGSR